MSNQVITFGEIMMRLSPVGNERFLQAKEVETLMNWNCSGRAQR